MTSLGCRSVKINEAEGALLVCGTSLIVQIIHSVLFAQLTFHIFCSIFLSSISTFGHDRYKTFYEAELSYTLAT